MVYELRPRSEPFRSSFKVFPNFNPSSRSVRMIKYLWCKPCRLGRLLPSEGSTAKTGRWCCSLHQSIMPDRSQGRLAGTSASLKVAACQSCKPPVYIAISIDLCIRRSFSNILNTRGHGFNSQRNVMFPSASTIRSMQDTYDDISFPAVALDITGRLQPRLRIDHLSTATLSDQEAAQ